MNAIDPAALAAVRHAARLHRRMGSLSTFARAYWPVVHPGRPLVWSWAYEYVCERFQAHLDRGWGTLVVALPLRLGKSTLLGVLACAHDLANRPERQWLTISGADFVTTRDSRTTRKLLADPTYRALVEAYGRGDLTKCEADQNEKRDFALIGGGGRQARTCGDRITGANVDVLGIDDPNDAKDAEIGDPTQVSKRFNETIDRFDNVWTDRINPDARVLDHEPGVRLVVGQRLYVNDLTGALMRRARDGAPDIECIVIPECWDPDHPDREFFPPCDPRTTRGEFLIPTLRADAFRDAILARPGGERKWATRHDQRPIAREGGVIRRDWYETRHYLGDPKEQRRSCVDIVLAMDPAGIEEIVGSDYTVIQVWGLTGEYCFLLAEYRGRWGLTEQEARFVAAAGDWRPKASLIEGTVNGLALLRRLHRRGIAARSVSPAGQSKLMRATEFIRASEAGQVWTPNPATCPWVSAVLDEWSGYGAGAANDDRLDAAAYAVAHLAQKSTGALFTGAAGIA